MLTALLAATSPIRAQDVPPPIVDMHLHSLHAADQGPPPLAMCAPIENIPPLDPREEWGTIRMRRLKDPPCANPIWSPTTDDELMERTLAILERRNIVAVTSGPPEVVARWRAAAPDRILPGYHFQLGPDAISPDSLRRLYAAGAIVVLGEVTNQFLGIAPDDPRFEPYLAVAEELDIPVGIHIGTGPRGAPYLGASEYRARLHSPLTLEEALVRHPHLRVWIMHAGWPMLDDLLALLWTHPQVHVDVGLIAFVLPRAEFHRYLQRIVESGFGSRVMFGSDQMVWPETIEIAIEAIESADFLTPEQKRAIFYDNAARFLRLDVGVARDKP
jgi:predicted TIM-barrel fold metal-dependent hydrolase